MPAGPVESVLPAIVDGRALTPRYIQTQLEALHSALVKSAAALQKAVVHDTGATVTDAWLEICTAGQAVRQEYDAISLTSFLDSEYSVAHGKDNLTRRSAYGCAFIVPSQHTRVASLFQAAAAAIAAGNCVIVYLPQTLSQTDLVLRQALRDALERETFVFADEKRLSGSNLTHYAHRFVSVHLDGSSNTASEASVETIVAPAQERTFAVVDRTADLASAARDIVRARFRFGGTSPYGACVVLVNEFVTKDFCREAADVFTRYSAETVSTDQARSSGPDASASSKRHLDQIDARTIVSGAIGTIAVSQNREKSLAPMKDQHPILLIVPVSSLDDAIDCANNPEGVLLAAHLFASAPAAKYLGQFISCRTSFINHIPVQLLIGSAAPPRTAVSMLARTPKEVFWRPSPQFVSESHLAKHYAEAIDSKSASRLITLRAGLTAPLTDLKLPMTTSIGFFEQGIILGVSIVGTLTIGSTAGIAGFGLWKAWQRYR